MYFQNEFLLNIFWIIQFYSSHILILSWFDLLVARAISLLHSQRSSIWIVFLVLDLDRRLSHVSIAFRLTHLLHRKMLNLFLTWVFFISCHHHVLRSHANRCTWSIVINHSLSTISQGCTISISWCSLLLYLVSITHTSDSRLWHLLVITWNFIMLNKRGTWKSSSTHSIHMNWSSIFHCNHCLITIIRCSSFQGQLTYTRSWSTIVLRVLDIISISLLDKTWSWIPHILMCVEISAFLVVSQWFSCSSLAYKLLSVNHLTSWIICRLDNTRLAEWINQVINIFIILTLCSLVLCIKALVKHCIWLDVVLGLNPICHIRINLLFIVTIWATSLYLSTKFVLWLESISKLLFCTWYCQSWSKVCSTTTSKR